MSDTPAGAKSPRPSTKAIIVEDGRLLCIVKEDDIDGRFYILPGGGQNRGETLPDTLVRECLEEVGAAVNVHELRFVREYIGANHEFAEFERDTHSVEFYFRCTLRDGDRATLALGPVPDNDQIGVEWLPLDRLLEFNIYPKAIRSLLQSLDSYDGPVYLGDIN